MGIAADVFQSVFVPESTRWLTKIILEARQRGNLEADLLTLDVMEKLRALGKDPDLVKHAREDAEKFLRVLTSQQEAPVENAIKMIEVTTQAEMNAEAGRRTELANTQMEKTIRALQDSRWMSDTQSAALEKAQGRWSDYAHAQAEFAAAEFEGVSMQPLVYATELEAAMISRTGELKRMLDEMRQRYRDDIAA